VVLLASVGLALAACAINAASNAKPASPPVPGFYADEPDCKVKSVQKLSSAFENITRSPSGLTAFTQQDSNGIYQVYVRRDGDESRCISCNTGGEAPRIDRNKPMISWHPSGQWLTVGVEENRHDNSWMPASWQRGLLQSGIWLNLWVTTADGSRWYQITDFKKTPTNPSDGYVGVAFTPDGSKAVWAEIIDGNVFANAFGVWKLYTADFHVGGDGIPHFANRRDITPAGAKWVEPGNFSPDGKHILLSSDIGIDNAQGQDQWSLDINTGQIQNLTHSPNVWDEHGLYSPNGKKISFMSSYPYRHEPDSYRTLSLKTEFMLMSADGSHLQQLTHFNVPGYPESQPARTIAAVAGFIDEGSQLYATAMGPNFSKTNWILTFEGRCGGN
jgi:hypothetical protein